MKIAVIGVTGLVGQLILKILEERNFLVSELIPVASVKSINKKVTFCNVEHEVICIEDAINKKVDIAIFSAGSSVSLKYAPIFAKNGTFVIDNSSAWRMDKSKKLIIPEINANILTKNDRIIANPNCSTIQMLMVLSPLHKEYLIKRVVVSTYQSVSGTGVKALKQLENEEKNREGETVYPHPIYKNCLPHCDDFTDNAYTKEELKLVNETHKILDNNINLTATAVRIPVVGGHSEAINVEFEKSFEINNIKELLEKTSGVKVEDDIKNNIYPMPISAKGKDSVFVGRIRRDFSQDNTLNLWIVADNLRKGAATNAVQIAEYIKSNFF